eukprot:CAMPEP_0197692576 /NCGR_PEP_ID=MMETSP1338-20131121/111307_1 /TAXON_ID=43686 ORGANISM="Pelagodinium beii, Strain RCC1491" /NCGR_SAMPLE_ID=MMETSP1338 /ASSEMBLY_ACC=CAM_ASM_000754 /LENGTH=87 /DNA_ID=CAMNT_0043275249 /DNA_START=101 /DNA_END=360 /DNA_ORIENTATION=-
MALCRQSFVECAQRKGCDQSQTCMYNLVYLAMVVFGLLLALASCWKTMQNIDMMHESITDNLSPIDRLQGRMPEPQSFFDGLTEIMG